MGVTCYQPGNDIIRYGVISPIDVSIDVGDLQSLIKIKEPSANLDIQILKVERLKKRNGREWVDSPSIKMTFAGDILPTAITICHSYYRVRPYIGQPLQCYNCQKMGHTAGSCKSGRRCLLCGGSHSKNDCVAPEQSFKCVNCSGPHRANSSSCSVYTAAKEIETVRAQTGKSYMEARGQVMKKHTPPIQANNTIMSSNPSYRDVAASEPAQTTTSVNENSEPKVNLGEEQFIEKLKTCLIEVLKSLFQKEVNEKDEETINDIISAQFSTSVSTSLNKKGTIRNRESSSSSYSSILETDSSSEWNKQINQPSTSGRGKEKKNKKQKKKIK